MDGKPDFFQQYHQTFIYVFKTKQKRPQTADESKKCKTLDVFVGKSKPAGQSIVSLSCRLLRLEIDLEKRVAFLTADASVEFCSFKTMLRPHQQVSSEPSRFDATNHATMRQVVGSFS